MASDTSGRLNRAVAGLLCTALMLLGTAPGRADGGHISVTDAWIRWLPGALPAGGYLTLRNDGDHPATLTAVSSSAYRMSMLHRSRMEGSVNHMEMLDAIPLPAHQTVTFADQGLHIMLEQPASPVHPGDHVALTLHFADGSTLQALAEVRGPAGGGTR